MAEPPLYSLPPFSAAAFVIPSHAAPPCQRCPCTSARSRCRTALFVAPMAGVTDRPFRQLCKRLGAGYAVSEMVTSRRDLWASAEDLAPRRPRRRGRARSRCRSPAPTPPMMAEAARLQHRPRRADHRHQHGLPGEEGLQRVGRLGADAATSRSRWRSSRRWSRACAPRGVPVTLKMRTGWCDDEKNARAPGARGRRTPAWRWSPCTAARASRATRAAPSTTPWPR